LKKKHEVKERVILSTRIEWKKS